MIITITFMSNLSAQTDVLVCGAASPQSWLDDVGNKLTSTGAFNSVTTYNTYLTGTPTLAYMQGFDAILVYTDYGAQDPVTLGNNLAAYIDGGGGVVSCVFANASVVVGGNFNTSTYQVIVPNNGQFSSPQLTLGTILDPCHPIIQGITNFDGGTSSYRSNSNTLASGAQFVANWSNGQWLVASKENVGPLNARRADLNFYPPSSDARGDFWQSSTQGAQLMANALLWVAGVTNPLPLAATPGAITGGTDFCFGTSTTYSISPVLNATNYVWTVPSGTIIQSGQGTTSITVDAGGTAGNITVTAQNICGANSPDSAVLAVNFTPLPILTLSSDSIDCNDGSDGTLDLNVSSGTPSYSYVWSTADTTEDISGLSIGNYSVTVTDAEGCTASASATVDAPPAFNVSFTQENDSCFGLAEGTIDLTVSGGSPAYTFTWSNSETTEDIGSLAAGNYSVTITDYRGCTTTTSATITEPPILNINYTTSMVNCNNGSDGSILATVTGGTPGYIYEWNNGDSTAFINNLSPGNYELTLTDTFGCSVVDTITITQPGALVVNGIIVNESLGNDGSIDLSVSGGTPGYVYDWSNGATTQDINGIAGGSYTVIVTDTNLCTDTVTFIVGSTVGLNGNDLLEISLYPNPSNGIFNLQVNKNFGNNWGIQIISITGEIMLTTVVKEEIQKFDLSNYASGVYFMYLNSPDSGRVVKQFIIE